MSDEILSRLLNADIDKLLSADSEEKPELKTDDQEYQGLLKLATVLAKVDFSPPKQKPFAEVVKGLQLDQELNDDELDLVAGGIDLNILFAQKKGNK